MKVNCTHCGKELERTSSRFKKSKSGLFFCCRKCQQAEQRIGGKLQPSHYGTAKREERKKYYCVYCKKEILTKNTKYCNNECFLKYSESLRQDDFPKNGWKIENAMKSGEYLYATVRNHPKSNNNGYVLHHRIVAENKIGRLLKDNEIVHHIDGNKSNNCSENLQVMIDVDHNRLHSTKFKDGHFVKLTCKECGKVFYRKYGARPEIIHNKNSFCSRRCNGIYQRRKQIENGMSNLNKYK